MTNQDLIKALVQNYGFKKTNEARLPTIDYAYPENICDGNSEEFRFSQSLRVELHRGAGHIRCTFVGKDILWTMQEDILDGVDKIAKRLGIEAQISGRINSIYAYSPLLFTGFGKDESVSYVVKPVIDHSFAWFTLTKPENEEVRKFLEERARENPYRGIFQRFLWRGK